MTLTGATIRGEKETIKKNPEIFKRTEEKRKTRSNEKDLPRSGASTKISSFHAEAEKLEIKSWLRRTLARYPLCYKWSGVSERPDDGGADARVTKQTTQKMIPFFGARVS